MIAFIFTLALSPSHAAAAVKQGPTEVKAEALKLKGINLYDAGAAAEKAAGPLVELKKLEVKTDWATCRDHAAKLKDKDLEPWIARQRLFCASKAFEQKKQTAGLIAAIKAVRAEWLVDGPWSNSLLDLEVASLAALADQQMKTNAADILKLYDQLLEASSQLSKAQKAKAYFYMAEAALQMKNEPQALYYYRQSTDLIPDVVANSRITRLSEKLNPRKKAETEAATEENVETVAAVTADGAEAQTDREIKQLLVNQQPVDAVRRMVEILKRFPGGVYARAYRDRCVELLAAAFESKSDNYLALISIMKDADDMRLADWAMSAHRRGMEAASLEFAEKALESLNASPSATSLHWIAGRAASFQGMREKATYHFDQLIQFHAATDEASEASLRLALIHVRDRNYQLAARILERLMGNGKKYDLVARYWRVRCLEKLGTPKIFEKERDELVQNYPFTYYGLVLRAERSGEKVIEFGKFDRSPLEDQSSPFWLAGAEKKAWARFIKLSAAGWLLEAQAELASVTFPKDPVLAFKLSQEMAAAGQYSMAITFSNRALDGESTLKHPRYLVSGFPKVYATLIDREAGARGLDPVLIRSLIRQESAFSMKAVSRSNAMGLMQMIPPTAQEVANELKIKPSIPDDMYRPEINIPMGTYYYAKVLKEFSKNVPLGLAAYNAGPYRLQRWMNNRPDLTALKSKPFESWEDEIWYDELPWNETSFYVKAILRNVLIYKLIDEGRVAWNVSFWSNLVKETGKESAVKTSAR